MNGAEYKEKTSQKVIQLSQYNSKIKTTKKNNENNQIRQKTL